MLKAVSRGLLLFFLSICCLMNAYAIKISSENTGQLLLAPLYLSTDDVLTKLTIINTRVDAAVSARLVVRDYNVSAKMLEFALYLSPGDVWTGYLYGGINQTKLFSVDDSVMSGKGGFAGFNAPLDSELLQRKIHLGVNNIGHIEVIGTSSFQAGHRYCASAGKLNPAAGETPCDIVTVKQGMSKDDLMKLSQYAAGVTSLKADFHGRLIYKNIASDGGGISTVQPEKLQITGMAEAVFQTGLRFNYTMIALQPSHYQWNNVGIDRNSGLPKPEGGPGACTDSAPYSCLPNYVISNPLFDSSLTAESGIGEFFGTANAEHSFVGDTGDHVIAIETLFARTEIKHAYSKGKTLLLTTFPSKYRHLNSSGPGVCQQFYGVPDSDPSGKSVYSSPFFWDEKGSLYYEFSSFDFQENSVYTPGPEFPELPDSSFSGGEKPELPPIPPNNQTIEQELWIASLDEHYAFDEGWAALKFIYQAGCGYEGVPSISYTLKMEEKSLLLEETF